VLRPPALSVELGLFVVELHQFISDLGRSVVPGENIPFMRHGEHVRGGPGVSAIQVNTYLSFSILGFLAQGKKKHRDCNDHKHDSSLITVHTCLPGRGSSRIPFDASFLHRLYVKGL
jgi:hypothetical protein